jgi:hypothetical protein
LIHDHNARLSKPDRPVGPVEPGTGPVSGPVSVQNRSAREPVKNRQNQKKPEKNGDPDGLRGSTGLQFLRKKTTKTTFFFNGIRND